MKKARTSSFRDAQPGSSWLERLRISLGLRSSTDNGSAVSTRRNGFLGPTGRLYDLNLLKIHAL